MGYTIGQAAYKLGLTTHTLRFYDKEGLLPFVGKNKSGMRVFSDQDLEGLVIINCLKETGLSLKEIKKYIDWCQAGNSTLSARLNLFIQQKQRLEEQMCRLQKHMEKIDYKIAYYKEAVSAGSDNILKKNACLALEKKRVFNAALKNK